MARTVRRPVLRWRVDGGTVRRPDTLAAEEPLQIRVEDGSGAPLETLTVTMRTPGDDFDLIAGWLAAEGAVVGPEHLHSMRFCSDLENLGTVEVRLAGGAQAPRSRAFATSSACGVCGADAVDDVTLRRRVPPDPGTTTVDVGVLAALPETLRAAQAVFDRTGGLHAAALASARGELLCVREDVGRHNAVDKVIGDAVRAGSLPLHGTVLQVSGRASFELVQKAAMAGIGVLAAVSAPSSLAAELADTVGLTLVGFSRGSSLNVYTHPERITGT